MSWEAVVEAVASGTGASIGVAAVARRWFRQAVQGVVREELRKQGAHLDRQDKRLERIEQQLTRGTRR